MYNSGKYGEVVMSITHNRVDGNAYALDRFDSIVGKQFNNYEFDLCFKLDRFDSIVGKEYEAEEVWRIICDINEVRLLT